MNAKIGILGIGAYLPDEIRRNDWWPASVVAEWIAKRRPAPAVAGEAVSPNAAQILAALAAQTDDPFQGTLERRIMPAGMTVMDMEVAAARDAIARAQVDPRDIAFVASHTVSPPRLLTNPAAVLHHRLGLPAECFAIQVEAAAYAFLAQLELASAMLRSAPGRYGLLVQACAASRLVEPHDPVAPYFGDAATAVVVGPVESGGILGSVHFVDGRYPDTLVAGVPGGTWYDPGRAVIHVADPAGMRAVLLQTVDLCKQSVDAVLARCGCAPAAIDFFCIHQGTPWLRTLAQESAQLHRAETIDTFSKTGYLFSAIMPLGLRSAEEGGILGDGDLVLLFGGGTGMTYGATVIEWGR